MRSLVISVFLYACELTTFSYSKECRPSRCYQTLLNISYKDHVTNEEFFAKGSKQPLENMMNS